MEHQPVNLSSNKVSPGKIGLAWCSETHAHPEDLCERSVGLFKEVTGFS